MASLSHICKCGHIWFSNGWSDDCPRCGDPEYTTHFDEDPQPTERDIRTEIYEGHRDAGLVPAGGINGRFPEDLR